MTLFMAHLLGLKPEESAVAEPAAQIPGFEASVDWVGAVAANTPAW